MNGRTRASEPKVGDEIVAVDIRTLRMALREPYTIAYDSFEATDNVLLRLRTRGGLTGIGCAAPAEEVTGESLSSAVAALERVREALPRQAFDAAALRPEIEAALNGCPAARAAVDVALLDLQARQRAIPLWSHLGGRLRPLRTSVTLGIAPWPQSRERATVLAGAGVRTFKIKGGADVDADIATIVALRQQVGTAAELRFDANQGYSSAQALHFAIATASMGVSVIEQPLEVGREAEWSRLRDRIAARWPRSAAAGTPPPLMVDESLLSVEDAVRLASMEGIDAFNIKLMKCGGVRPAAEIASIATRAGIGVMLSCMDETAAGIAAALHLAMALPAEPWVDLDGHLDLIDDPTEGAVQWLSGALLPKPGPGLSVTVRP